jgi:hypothetical protein
VFEDKAGADESVRLAANYVKKHLSKLLTQNQGSRLSTDNLSKAGWILG